MTRQNLLSLLLLTLPAIASRPSQAIEPLPQNVPLQNAGFEMGLNNWSPTALPGQVSTTDIAHSGRSAVKIDAQQQTNNPSLAQQANSLHGGATYRFSVWARVADGSPPVDAAIKIEDYNAAGANTNGHYKRLTLPAKGQWQQISLATRVDADTVAVKLYLRIFGLGTAFFDDAALELVKEAPEIFIIEPHRSLVDDSKSRKSSYQLQFHRPWPAGAPSLVATLHDLKSAGTREIPVSLKLSDDRRRATATLALPALPEGDYTVDFVSQRGDEKIRTEEPAYIFTYVRRRRPDMVQPDGTIQRDDKPFFPIGIYHPGGSDSYAMLAQNGFNTIQGSASTNLESLQTLLDAAQQSGLAVDVPLYVNLQVARNLDNSLAILRRFANHPAVLDWKIIDEPDLRPEIAHEVPPVYRALKAADPNHPLELTLSGDGDLPFWSHFSDIVQIDRYPLPGHPLTQITDSSARAMSTMEPWQNLSVALQCGWNPDLTNQPSVAQARSMVYLALIGGAKGIWWYSMYDPGWDLTKTPLWPHMKAINAEIESLSLPILEGKAIETIRCDNPKVHFRGFDYAGKTYLLVTNPENESQKASFTLPLNLQKWRFLDGSDSGTLEGTSLKISLAGIDSKTLVVEK